MSQEMTQTTQAKVNALRESVLRDDVRVKGGELSVLRPSGGAFKGEL